MPSTLPVVDFRWWYRVGWRSSTWLTYDWQKTCNHITFKLQQDITKNMTSAPTKFLNQTLGVNSKCLSPKSSQRMSIQPSTRLTRDLWEVNSRLKFYLVPSFNIAVDRILNLPSRNYKLEPLPFKTLQHPEVCSLGIFLLPRNKLSLLPTYPKLRLHTSVHMERKGSRAQSLTQLLEDAYYIAHPLSTASTMLEYSSRWTDVIHDLTWVWWPSNFCRWKIQSHPSCPLCHTRPCTVHLSPQILSYPKKNIFGRNILSEGTKLFGQNLSYPAKKSPSHFFVMDKCFQLNFIL